MFTEKKSLKKEDATIQKVEVATFPPFSFDCGKYRVEVYVVYNYNESLRNFGLVSIVLIYYSNC